ncbi:hypothetical protein C8Q74DRAFT_1316590 [Fomes fomentarius]|nr:hypothetical protein C8Q74DRAFT_1316590 [Fomes fomentarius]
MAYEHYRNSMPGWGTSQFQFGSPPAPMFQPQPSWGGFDFYNAHAINPDPGLFHSIMSRAPYFGSMGIAREDARHWHRRIYSGLVPLMQLLPDDIGAAAAYEAYRTWKHNSFLHEPLSADREQQREGLVGMAIAEATRLWQHAGRQADAYGMRAACEAAAAAASVLAERWLTQGSVGGGGGISPSYASSGSNYGGGGGGPGGGSISTPGLMGGPQLGGMGMGARGISPVGSPMLGGMGGMGGMGGISPAGSPMLGAAGVGPGMGGMGGMGAGMGASMGMGMGMGMGETGANVQTVPPGSTVIFHRPSRHHHQRSRSVEVVQAGGAPGAGYGGYGGGGAGYAGGMQGGGYGYGGGGYGGSAGGGYGGGSYGAGGNGAGGGPAGGGAYGGAGRIYG